MFIFIDKHMVVHSRSFGGSRNVFLFQRSLCAGETIKIDILWNPFSSRTSTEDARIPFMACPWSLRNYHQQFMYTLGENLWFSSTGSKDL